MDRRDFLKTTGAVAVAAGSATAPAQAIEDHSADGLHAPAILAGRRVLTLGSQWSEHPGWGPERLARRIESATDGRYRFNIAHNAGDAEVSYGSALRHFALHPAFAFCSGLPFTQGLDPADQAAWVAVGGGSMLWDELAAAFAFKPLLAGHTGTNAGAWAAARLETAADLARAAVHADGLAADVLRALGATAVHLAPHELRPALADGHIQAAEWLGPPLSAGITPLSRRIYEPGFHGAGVAMTLDVRDGLWNTLSVSDRLLFEACAAQEYQLSLAEARAHGPLLRQVEAREKWPIRLPWSEALEDAFREATADVVAQVAATDPAARRMHDSYQSFRHLLGEDLIA